MPTPFQVSARAVQLAAFVLSASQPDGLPWRKLWPRLLELDPALEYDWREAAPDATSGLDTNLSHNGTTLVKAGWLRRTGRVWRLTGLGAQALTDYPDSEDFFREAVARYLAWRRDRPGFDAAAGLLSELPDGRWVRIGELAAEFELDADALAACFQGTRPNGWHLALGYEGDVWPELRLQAEELAEWKGLLVRDDLFDQERSGGDAVRVKPEARLAAEEITALVLGESSEVGTVPEQPRRVWIVRGTDEAGVNLIRTLWREAGVVTLPAERLPVLGEGAGRERVRTVIDQAYSSAPPARRERLTGELHTFLSRISERDIVVCTDGSLTYLGEVRGQARFGTPESGRAVVQRAVVWRNLDAPLDFFKDLPAGMSGRLADADARLVEASEYAGDLEALLGKEPEQAPSAPAVAPELPDATPVLAAELTIRDEDTAGAEWLQECVELLREKRQLIFHGPPGTGKTHTALALARHLTGGSPTNTRLVQFHPAYSYEDFFEGFRPRAVDAGPASGGLGQKEAAPAAATASSGIVFDLVKGPLRRLADSADERPAEIFVLVIDEINRGNIAKVFGELYFLLEYRHQFVHLLYGSDEGRGFRLPPNLYLIGTMNTVDRSVALMDAAMRRRFSFVELHPDTLPTSGVLTSWLAANGFPDDTARLLDELNHRIGEGPDRDREFRVGPSYFMRPTVHSSPKALARLWRAEILPLLTEYHWGDGTDVPGTYGLEVLRGHLGLGDGTDAGAAS
ncbi:AAA family ATPase [Streptomyces sp. V4-01]|uniref:AAA family ATPase n=1 Tax=Actinacidiphila polyblastidii TaxID=3110430 RepID=A0ABU7P6E3_9ACTN|nr:AAA family ATPase [Streptomyces sp. V4-01]